MTRSAPARRSWIWPRPAGSCSADGRSSRCRRPGGVGALLLAPGAGSSAQHPSLVAIEAAVAPMPVQRMDFPYRKAGRKAPDRAPVLLGRGAGGGGGAASIGPAWSPARLALGGRSMGGRMCSMAVAEGLPAAALVLISYPLHPPGKPDALRTAHLPAARPAVPLRPRHPGPVRHAGRARGGDGHHPRARHPRMDRRRPPRPQGRRRPHRRHGRRVAGRLKVGGRSERSSGLMSSSERRAVSG